MVIDHFEYIVCGHHLLIGWNGMGYIMLSCNSFLQYLELDRSIRTWTLMWLCLFWLCGWDVRLFCSLNAARTVLGNNSSLLKTLALLANHASPHCIASQWCHNERDGVSNHQPHDCLLKRLSRRRSKENIKAPRHLPLCGEFTGRRTKDQ